MATKQINQLTAATAIEDTDSIPLQTVGGVTKKFTPTELKTNLDGRYQQFGEVKFESETGDISGAFTSETGHLYKIYVNTTCDNSGNIYGKQVLSAIYETAADIPVTILNIHDVVYGHSFISINSLGFIVTTSTGYTLKVYKIIDMGVAQ